MLNLPLRLSIWCATTPTDLRRGFDGLAALVSDAMGQDPLSGHLFVFFNRRRDRVKLLYWDGDGLAIWYKRLESGTFQRLTKATSGGGVEISADELRLLLSGIDLSSVKRRPRYHRPAAVA